MTTSPLPTNTEIKTHQARLYAREDTKLKIIWLDGLTRAGKFLLGMVVSHLTRVEYYQYAPLLEHFPIMARYGLISRSDASAYMRLYADTHIYDQAIGRNLNTRPQDGSAITRAIHAEEYLARQHAPDGRQAVDKLICEGRMPAFLIHEMLPFADLLFEAFPSSVMINIQRHPVDLIESWHKRGWGERFFKPDMLDLIPVLEKDGRRMPWFAVDRPEFHANTPPLERVVWSILHLQELEDQAAKKIGPTARLQRICYEELISRPDGCVEQMAAFLKSDARPSMSDLLKRERCDRRISMAEGSARLEKISQSVAPDVAQALKRAARMYEEKWGLENYCA